MLEMLATTEGPPGLPISPDRLSAWVKRQGPIVLVCCGAGGGSRAIGSRGHDEGVVGRCTATGKQAAARCRHRLRSMLACLKKFTKLYFTKYWLRTWKQSNSSCSVT
jgi:hypothetical protein